MRRNCEHRLPSRRHPDNPLSRRGTNLDQTRNEHDPPVTDSMETLFKLLKEENNAAVRAVLGHFIFVYIHPYMDGNGRTGRFLMNLMMISGGYNWTVIRVERRKEYMEALEQASVHENIVPFTKVILSEMHHWKQLAQ